MMMLLMKTPQTASIEYLVVAGGGSAGSGGGGGGGMRTATTTFTARYSFNCNSRCRWCGDLSRE